MTPEMEDLFLSAPDGLRLHVRRFGGPGRPVVCLPGLARTADDFEALATALAADSSEPRQVFALDYRGRGRSAYGPNPANYTIATELADLLAVLTALEVEPAVFVGTSRGGILAMALAAARPGAITGVVLNDIGPVIEIQGLLRIKSYLGQLPQPKDFDDAAEILRRVHGAQFPKLEPAEWLAFARRTFEDTDGTLTPRYDRQLATVLRNIDPAHPWPPFWNAFDALADVPVMVIRGANTDLLSADTVEAMRRRRPDLVTLTVPDQGHAPLLIESAVIEEIRAFIGRC